MNKTASSMTPLQILMLSALGGAGTFGSIRLLQDAMRATKPREGLPETQNELKIDVPGMSPGIADPPGLEQRPKLKIAFMDPGVNSSTPVNPHPDLGGATGDHSQGGFVNNLLRILAVPVGVGGGFWGGKALYDTYQNKRLQDEIDTTKQKYLMALTQAKSASETPMVDGFCDILKYANDDGDDLPSVPEILWHLVPGHNALQLAGGLTAGATGVSVLGLMMMADQKRREAEQAKSYPTRVVLNSPPSGKHQLPGT
jgi:hypothetical protein